MLINAGSPLDTQDKNDNTALTLAVYYRQIKIGQMLIDVGISLDIQNRNDNTALILAAILRGQN